MDSGDCNGVRPRMRIIPEMPAFPDLKSPIVTEGSQAEERQSFGDHINSNGGNKWLDIPIGSRWLDGIQAQALYIIYPLNVGVFLKSIFLSVLHIKC